MRPAARRSSSQKEDNGDRPAAGTAAPPAGEEGKDESSALSNVRQLQQQAQALRDEAAGLQTELRQQKLSREARAISDEDRWIEESLIRWSDGDTVLLNTVEETTAIFRDRRYSPEQVRRMFRRVSAQTSNNRRSKISPTLELLVEAAGRMDCLEPDDNPNKRWGVRRVESDLRQRLFARDWGIELEQQHPEEEVWP